MVYYVGEILAANNISFEKYMEENTNLLESTIMVYNRIINRYHKLYGDLSIDNINKYIADGFRNHYNMHIKYAFKHYFAFKEMKHRYQDLINVHTKPRKRWNKSIPKAHVRQIINNIENPLYRDWAHLCYYTGARAFEIISLKEENIDTEYKGNAIKIRLEGKRSKERVTFLSRDKGELLEKYMRNHTGFIFLPNDLDKKETIKKVNNLRTYFYKAIRRAAEQVGYDSFGTHQLRRCFADYIKSIKNDIRLVQKALGHSNINTTARYFADDPSDVKEAVMTLQNDTRE